MAFPTIPTAAANRILGAVQANTTSTRTFPSLSSPFVKNAGDLLIAVCMVYDGNSTNAEFSSWGGGFTEFGDFASTTTLSIGCAYKFATGSETGTFTVTTTASQAGHAAMILMSIPGAHATSQPESGGYATGTNANADPGTLNPGWGTDDILWIGVAGCGETSLTGSFTGLASAGANYTDYFETGISADAVGGIEGAVAFRQLTSALEDPSAFVADTSNARWGAITIAVRPSAATFTDAPAELATATGAGHDATTEIVWPIPNLLMAPMVAP